MGSMAGEQGQQWEGMEARLVTTILPGLQTGKGVKYVVA